MAYSPGGARLWVQRYSGGSATGDDYATIAYDVRTGARLWVSG